MFELHGYAETEIVEVYDYCGFCGCAYPRACVLVFGKPVCRECVMDMVEVLEIEPVERVAEEVFSHDKP